MHFLFQSDRMGTPCFIDFAFEEQLTFLVSVNSFSAVVFLVWRRTHSLRTLWALMWTRLPGPVSDLHGRHSSRGAWKAGL